MDATREDIKELKKMFAKELYADALQDMAALSMHELSQDDGVRLLASLIKSSPLRGGDIAKIKKQWAIEVSRMTQRNSPARVESAREIIKWLNIILKMLNISVRQK